MRFSVRDCRAFVDRGLRGVCHAVAVLPERWEEVESAAAPKLAVQQGAQLVVQRGALLAVQREAQRGARMAVELVVRLVLSVPEELGASVASERWVPDARRGGGFPEKAGLRSDCEAVDTVEEGRACARRVFHRHSVWLEVRRGARLLEACFFPAVDRCEEWWARVVEAGRQVRASVGDLRPVVCAAVAWESSVACLDCVDCHRAW